jgi:hypothetical protein
VQHVSTNMSHHQANLEPLNISDFLLTDYFVSKVVDPCVSSGWHSVLVQLSLPLGVRSTNTKFKLQLEVESVNKYTNMCVYVNISQLRI